MSLLHLKSTYAWQNQNEKIREQLNIEDKVCLFQSLEQALLEISTSLHLLYSHKMQFIYQFGYGVHGDAAKIFLIRQGLKALDLSTQDELAWDEKKMLCAIVDTDDVLTSQNYCFDDLSIVDEKMFRVWISHHAHVFRGLKKSVGATDAFLHVMEGGGVIAVLGRRLQNLSLLVAPYLSQEALPKGDITSSTLSEEWVRDVESGWAGSQAFGVAGERTYDRALIYWENLDASALRELLIEKGVESALIETPSLTRWADTALLENLKSRGIEPNKSRGLLILSAKLSEDLQFKEKLEAAVSDVEKRSEVIIK